MSNSKLIFEKEWGPISKLNNSILSKLTSNLQEICLEPGDDIHSSNEITPGVFLIKEGTIRLLALNENREIFTLKKYYEGHLVGINNILRGVTGQYYSSSTKSRIILLPTKEFIHLFLMESSLKNYYIDISLPELFSTLSLSKDGLLKTSTSIKEWIINNYDINNKIINIQTGKSIINGKDDNYLVSSNNIEKYPCGSIIRNGSQINVLGKLPARLIPFPSDWPPKYLLKNEKLLPEKSNLNNELIEVSSLNEALEDWYGTLNDDKTYPHSKGSGYVEESLACLRMLSLNFDLPFRRELLRKILKDQQNNSKETNASLNQIAAIFDFIGLRTTPLYISDIKLFNKIMYPCFMYLEEHPIVLWEKRSDKILIGDPIKGQYLIHINKLFNKSLNAIELLTIESTSITPKKRFGLNWFLPSIRKYKSNLLLVIISSFFVQLLALFNPLLIQQIIDAVISQGNISSLNIFGTLLIFMAFSQALLSSLRTYLFSDTTNRIDISLGSSVIHHLLRLPLNYFSKRAVGEVSSRLSELEKIRSFLTGTALTVFLDSFFSLIYILVMLLYSVKLTLWALSIVPFFIILSAFVSPILRAQLREQATATSKVNSHIVETISGMETIKGQGIELQSKWRWEKLYGDQISAGFKNTITSTAASSTSNFLQQISGLIIIWVGARLILNGEMSIGELIAFRILSGYVTNPILRLTSLWQNFQETAISLERLSDIVDNRKESELVEDNLPPIASISGDISYKNINFKFENKSPLKLSNVSFDISAGSFVGIVGASGSGKSTLLKLLTRFYNPNEGIIYIDNNDIAKVDLYSLRSQIGVVPQESLLFKGTILENIAITRPESTFDEISNAAKIACAHEFINKLENGYNTKIGEKGSGLSGGERQRIAISRMLLKKPNLLIMDEATSALDFDTEQRLIDQVFKNFRGKTILFITHRLENLKDANKILVMNNGILVEEGTHKQLISIGGYYSTLYNRQILVK